MTDRSTLASVSPPPVRRNRLGASVRGVLLRAATRLFARLMGSADSYAVETVASRELRLILRSPEWFRFVGQWVLLAGVILSLPLLWRSDFAGWRAPGDRAWFAVCGYLLQVGVAGSMVQWSVRRLRRDLYTSRLDELLLTRCSPADIAMGEALAAALASAWLVAGTVPACLIACAIGGRSPWTAGPLALSLLPAGALGVWFGMGWGMAFTLRRSAAIVPLTQWWILGPAIPIFVCLGVLGFLGALWPILAFIPGSSQFIRGAAAAVGVAARYVLNDWNPFLPIAALAGVWRSAWLTDWLVLVFVSVFMMRKSMDAVQLSLAVLPERGTVNPPTEHWIHHDGHYFTQFSGKARREPAYRDGGNAIAAFDAALGHRIFLHPFLWSLAIMGYLCLFLWSFFLPHWGLYPGVGAVLLPATGALLLTSGGVAVSFGWERDQHRWPALAVLPISDLRLALGKIKGVVRPTLWLSLLAGSTAVILGLRGALPLDPSLWMALHVLIFPVALACVSAALALSTPTLAEALWRWAVLGAIPTLASVLPEPIGGENGWCLPFSPPLLALVMVFHGATPGLVRSSVGSLGLDFLGIAGSLLILGLMLRPLTVGERD